MDIIERFDSAMSAFHYSLAERLRKVMQTSGKPMEVHIAVSTYVIPGFHYEIEADGGDKFMIWIGANFNRLFFITRLLIGSEKAKDVFKFTFGGAENIGWHMNYESVSDNEVSIWATRMCEAPLVSGYETDEPEPKALISDSGAFWAIDIGMMVQSMIRTSQRHHIKPSTSYPEPL